MERDCTMPMTFYAENIQNRAESVYVTIPMATADHLLFTMRYRLRDIVSPRGLFPTDLLSRIRSLRRQFALGRSREFTTADIGQEQLLSTLQGIERVAEQAHLSGSNVMIISA
jgi:hypothetical protein